MDPVHPLENPDPIGDRESDSSDYSSSSDEDENENELQRHLQHHQQDQQHEKLSLKEFFLAFIKTPFRIFLILFILFIIYQFQFSVPIENNPNPAISNPQSTMWFRDYDPESLSEQPSIRINLKSNEKSLFNSDNPYTSIIDSEGSLLRCFIPDLFNQLDSDSQHQKYLSEQKQVINQQRIFNIKNLFYTLHKDHCFQLPGEYWHYEVCQGKSATQIHFGSLNGKPVQDRISLGTITNSDWISDDNSLANSQDLTTTSDTAPVLIQYYDMGTVCDLTGQPRKASVRWSCPGPQAASTEISTSLHHGEFDTIPYKSSQTLVDTTTPAFGGIISISEISTCKYEIQAYSTALCGHPAYDSIHHTSETFVDCVPDRSHHVKLSPIIWTDRITQVLKKL